MSKVVRLFASKHARGFAACSLAVVVLIVFSLVAPYLCQHDAELAGLSVLDVLELADVAAVLHDLQHTADELG